MIVLVKHAWLGLSLRRSSITIAFHRMYEVIVCQLKKVLIMFLANVLVDGIYIPVSILKQTRNSLSYTQEIWENR